MVVAARGRVIRANYSPRRQRGTITIAARLRQVQFLTDRYRLFFKQFAPSPRGEGMKERSSDYLILGRVWAGVQRATGESG
jgi:hypothetical protein